MIDRPVITRSTPYKKSDIPPIWWSQIETASAKNIKKKMIYQSIYCTIILYRTICQSIYQLIYLAKCQWCTSEVSVKCWCIAHYIGLYTYSISHCIDQASIVTWVAIRSSISWISVKCRSSNNHHIDQYISQYVKAPHKINDPLSLPLLWLTEF